jgi:cathepsin L
MKFIFRHRFISVEQLESYLAIETKSDVVILSPQQITSCSPNPMNCGGHGGCLGSIPEMGFVYSQMMGIVK